MNKYHFFLFSFVLSSGVLPAQDWELVLASGDTVRDLSFKELQNEILLATQLGKPITDVQTFEVHSKGESDDVTGNRDCTNDILTILNDTTGRDVVFEYKYYQGYYLYPR